LPIETTTAGREFTRRFNNTLVELQLQTGIHRRIENLLNDFAQEHPNLRASYISREVDEGYFQTGQLPPEAMERPRLQGIAVDGERIFEFIAFAHGLWRDAADLRSIVQISETWLEPKPDQPFILRVLLLYNFQAATILYASTGEGQDQVQEFVARLKYLRGW